MDKRSSVVVLFINSRVVLDYNIPDHIDWNILSILRKVQEIDVDCDFFQNVRLRKKIHI